MEEKYCSYCGKPLVGRLIFPNDGQAHGEVKECADVFCAADFPALFRCADVYEGDHL